MRNWRFYILLTLSVSLNVFFLISHGLFEMALFKTKHIEEIEKLPLKSSKDFENNLYQGSIYTIENGKKTFTPKKWGGTISNLNYNFKGYPKEELYMTSEMGYLMIATIEKAVKQKDISTLKKIKKIFDSYIIDKKIDVVDQSLYGIVAIYLYKETKEKKYFDYTNKLALWLKGSYVPHVGILYRKGANCNVVDGLGMYIPFLMEYSRFTNKLEYEVIAIDCFENYVRNAVDTNTGIAYHGYCINPPKIKIGSANWGRGNAWMALAIAYLPTEKLSHETKKRCSLFQETMLKIYKNQGEIRQFINDGSLDLSATIPVLFLLEKNGRIKVNKLLYSKYLRGDILYFSSGPTTAINDYSPFRGPNMLSQAIMLKWLVEYN